MNPDHYAHACRELGEVRRILDRLAVHLALGPTCPFKLEAGTDEAQAIRLVVAAYFRIAPEIVYSKRRTEDVAWARQVAMVLCRKLTSLSLSQIGEIFQRDHATIMHAEKHVSERMETSQQTKAQVEEIERRAKEALSKL